jgi:uncharacterized protein YjbK
MKIKKEMILREIAGESILVPGGDAVLDLNGLFVMTETGAFIWEILSDVESEAEILQRILKEYEIDEETAKNDIAEFLEKLRSFGIID